MPDLSQQNNESTVIAENTDVYFGLEFRQQISRQNNHFGIAKIHSLPPARKKKIFKVRQQLAEGTYDIDERLNVALDRLLEELVA